MSKKNQTMKKNNSRVLLSTLGILLLLLISCNSDEGNGQFNKEPIPLFDESVTDMIHGVESKSWHITEVINLYYDSNYDLEIDINCVRDDIYTFSSQSEDVLIELGDNRCFGQNDDGIFTADVEIFQSRLLYFNDTVVLEYVRGYINDEGTASGSSQRWYKLAEISEDRMVFHREGGNYIGEYKQALVFEKIVE
jgi:hypothetical protein